MDYAEEKAEKIGIQKGFQKGIENRNVEIVQKSLKKGLSVDTISDLIDLSIEEINKIIKGSE